MDGPGRDGGRPRARRRCETWASGKPQRSAPTCPLPSSALGCREPACAHWGSPPAHVSHRRRALAAPAAACRRRRRVSIRPLRRGKNLGTFRVAQRGSNDVNARAGALVLHARRNATSLQSHHPPVASICSGSTAAAAAYLIWRIHIPYRHHTAASKLEFQRATSYRLIALVRAEQQHCSMLDRPARGWTVSASPSSRCMYLCPLQPMDLPFRRHQGQQQQQHCSSNQQQHSPARLQACMHQTTH